MQENIDKKIKLPRIINYLLGLTLLSLGMSILLNLRMGMSATASLPATIYSATNIFTAGRWITIVQVLFIIASIVITRKIKLSFGLAFVSVTLTGLIIDMFTILFSNIVIEMLLIKLLLILPSCLFMIIGVSLIIMSQFPMVPDLQMFYEVHNKYGIAVGTQKTITDVTFVVISSFISYFIIGEFVHVGIGTVVCALVIGNGLNIIKPLVNKVVANKDSKGFHKLEALFEYDILSLIKK